MFIDRSGRIGWKRLRRDLEPRRRLWRNEQLGRSVGNGGSAFHRRQQRHGRKRLGRSALDGRCHRLGWIDGNEWGDGWSDSRAIGRYERPRREVGARWAHGTRWRCAWR